MFHGAVVDAVDGEVHEEDCQKVVGGSRGATVNKIQDIFSELSDSGLDTITQCRLERWSNFCGDAMAMVFF